MSLTLGTAPFSSKRRGLLNSRIDGPAHLLYFEPYERRMRAVLGGETVIDTTGGMLLYESNIGPVLYVPQEDVRADLLTRTDHTTHCPFKGDATYWSVGDAENVLWGYEQPIESAAFLLGYVAPYWDRFDAWYEEDEQLHTKFRDPYHRIDVRETDARVTVRAGGELIAESDRARLLFETGIRHAPTCRSTTSAASYSRPPRSRRSARTRARPRTGRWATLPTPPGATATRSPRLVPSKGS